MYNLDLGAWQPEESQRGAIIRELRGFYEGTMELCGEGEEAEEAKRLLMKVMARPLEECRDEIQGFFLESYDAVGGNLDLYKNSPGLIELIKMTLRPANIEETPQAKALLEGIELLMGYGMTLEMASVAMERIVAILTDVVIDAVAGSLRKGFQ